MMQFSIVIFLFVFGIGCVRRADSTNSENDISQGTSYGFAGSYAGSGPVNFPQFDFENIFGNYFQQLRSNQEKFLQDGGGAYSFSYASSSPNSKAFAKSQIIFDKPSRRKARKRLQQQAIAAGQRHPDLASRNAFGSGSSSPDGSSFAFAGPIDQDGSAFASGSIGPDGIQQTASVYPENPNSPNVNVRFGGSNGPSNGFQGVYTVASSRTENVDGKPKTFRDAETTVVRDGKVVSTYKSHNP